MATSHIAAAIHTPIAIPQSGARSSTPRRASAATSPGLQRHHIKYRTVKMATSHMAAAMHTPIAMPRAGARSSTSSVRWEVVTRALPRRITTHSVFSMSIYARGSSARRLSRAFPLFQLLTQRRHRSLARACRSFVEVSPLTKLRRRPLSRSGANPWCWFSSQCAVFVTKRSRPYGDV